MFFILPVFVLFILVVVWQSGVLGDIVSAFLGHLLPWLCFPVTFVLGTIWITDRTHDAVGAAFAVLIPLLYLLGGLLQIRMSYKWSARLSIRRVTAHDTHTHWPIAFRVRIWGAIAVVIGAIGVFHPQPLRDLFREHKAGLPLREAVVRMFKDDPELIEMALARHKSFVEPVKSTR